MPLPRRLVALSFVFTLFLAGTSYADCQRLQGEDLVVAAHRCVGWLQHPDDARRTTRAPADDHLFATLEPAQNRNEMFPGLGVLAGDAISTIVEIAVERARRQGLEIVRRRIEDGVCHFNGPPQLAAAPPLLPRTCTLVQETDLLSLLGQARALREALTLDITRIASAEFSAGFGDLPAFNQSATAAFSLIQRYAHDSNFRPGRDDVRPIAEAFLNAPWATRNGTAFVPVVAVTKELAAVEVAVSAARVYLTARQLRPAGSADRIDIVEIIDLQRRLCHDVFETGAGAQTVCPLAGLELLDSANLAVRSVAGLVTEQTPNYTDALRATLALVFDSLASIQSTRVDANGAGHLRTVRWVRTVVLAAIEIDAPRLVSALAELGRDVLASEPCDMNCAGRRKTVALLSGIAAYSMTYIEIPPNLEDAQKAALVATRQTARKEALESIIDGATDRRNRAGDSVWSLGLGVGATIGSVQHVDGDTPVNHAFQLHAPMGVAWQHLPSPGWKGKWPVHVMATVLDLGNYLQSDHKTNEAPDWQAIFAPGIEIGIPLSASPSNFFIAGASATYSPRFKSTGSETRGAWHVGGFITFYLPLWDLN